ncbi:hypothetical protein [Fibrella forsythiae]|uniref:Uncharacterized protein n=1 Tax=Fibrella forsythiae TaxID=2817061 RepID=A0ABS3JMH4_9BACT|nr:hypothetical protein [Fibrella forsythiae]MBO0951218.1 hypothetical protein [Fibrella forsythiae]
MGLIVKLSGTTFTDPTLPKLYRDSILNAGSMLLFDFKTLATYAGGVAPAAGMLANGFAMNNLVDAAPAATVNGATVAYNAAGAIEFNGSGNLTFGDNYNLASSNADFLNIMWIKMTAASAAYAQLFGRSTTTTAGNTQYRLDMGADGLTPRGSAGGANNIGTVTIPPTSAQALNTVFQVAYSRVGTAINAYWNGIKIRDYTAFNETGLANPATTPNMGGGVKGLVYRAYMENLTVSGKNPLAQVQADYAANSARFV